MNRLRLVTRSLAHHWRTGTMVVFGLATATAFVTGALVTGDSVHGSLRDTGLARLGRITHAMVAPAYFRAALAEDLQAVGEVSAAVLTQGAARNLDTDAVTPGVTVLGVDPGFWQLHDAGLELSGRECAINEALAGDLGVAVGDALLLTIHRQRAIASDTLFARRERQDIAPSMRLTVKQVLPAGGTGDFRLDTQSSAPRNVFISRDWLDSSLQLNGKANVLVASGEAEVLAAALEQACTLEDHGLRLTPNDTRGDLDLTSDAMLLTEQQVSAARAAAADAGTRAARTSVYLATDIATRGPSTRAISYAVVAGLESLRESDPIPTPGTAWVNVWAASDLACAPGDALDISYMVPTDDGTYPIDEMTAPVERVVELAGPTADRSLVPNFEGMTDAVNMSDWDPPFPIDLDRVTDRDEEYWDLYRATPKVFVGLDDVREMWQSAPGRDDADWVTSMRVGIVWPTEGDGFGPYFSLKLLQRLTLEASGLVFAPVRELTVEASEGTSDFGQLLLSLSMFLVMSGAGLAAMLLRLSVDRRASETGIMLACGCNTKLVGRVLFAEGALLSGLGAVVGVPAGLLYAYAMVAALGSWWQGALGSMPTLWLHVSAGNLVAGGVPGLVVGLLAAWWSVRRLRKRRVLELLGGWQAMVVAPERKRPWAAILTLVLSLGLAVALGGLAAFTDAVPAAGAFFGIGWALLIAGLAAAGLVLRSLRKSRGATQSLGKLSLRNAAAGGGRSLLTLGLLASATFMVVAVATNARTFSGIDASDRKSGTGGFALQATASVPLPYDLGTKLGREKLGFAVEDEAAFEGVEVMSFLASRGEDISCLNLTRPSSPRVLGAPWQMTSLGGGRFSPKVNPLVEAPPWSHLGGSDVEDGIPAFGDASSVQWSLHSGLGKTYAIPQGDLRFVGLLPGSIFARELIVSERNFRDLFPSVTAPSYFLIDTPEGGEDAVAEALRRNLGEMGLQVRSTREVLNDFIRVQNTYLSMFLALGGLGILLGTVGLGVALLRNALERRRELALMTAIGHSRGSLARMLLTENGCLLVAGMAWGALSALVAVSPHVASAQAEVNWTALAGVLIAVLAIGLVTCIAAVGIALRADLVPALRRE